MRSLANACVAKLAVGNQKQTQFIRVDLMALNLACFINVCIAYVRVSNHTNDSELQTVRCMNYSPKTVLGFISLVQYFDTQGSFRDTNGFSSLVDMVDAIRFIV